MMLRILPRIYQRAYRKWIELPRA